MEKITPNMSIRDMILVMSEGNPGAMTVLVEMLRDPRGIFRILLLDTYDIRGSKIWGLYKDCSGENMEKFYKTLEIIRGGAYSKEEIKANLELPYSLPFLYDSVKEEDYTKDGEKLMPFSDGWLGYVEANRALLIPKLEELKKQFGKGSK